MGISKSIPTTREFMYDKPICTINKECCIYNFESVNAKNSPRTCKNCKVAWEYKKQNG